MNDFKLVGVKKNVWLEPLLYSEDIFFLDAITKGLVKLDRHLDEIRVPDIQLAALFEWRGAVHWQGVKFIDLNSLEIVEKLQVDLGKGDDLGFSLKSGNQAIFFIENLEKGESNYYLVDNNLTNIHKKISRPVLISGNKVICRAKDEFICNTIPDGNEKWRINIKAVLNANAVTILGYVTKELLNYDETLFVSVSDRVQFVGTLCIDINSGQILKRIEEFGGFMYPDKKYIYTASKKTIKRLDVKSFEVSEFFIDDKIFTELDLNIEYTRSVVDDGKLYFVAQKGKDSIFSYVGIIDLATFKLIWYKELLVDDSKKPIDKNRYQIMKLVTNGQILTAYCAGTTMFVFLR